MRNIPLFAVFAILGAASTAFASAVTISNPSFEGAVIDDKVENKQVAPTILRALHLDANKLKGARAEHTTALPGFER